jgi:signal transduction histidine kinase
MTNELPRADAPPSNFAAPTSGPARVLVVDGDDAVAQTVANILRQERHEVDAAASAAEALEALAGRSYDVVLTELSLAEQDGTRLVRELRRLLPPPCCVVLTGYASLESAVAALRHGAYDYLVKPCVIEDLKQTVARAAAQRRLSLLAAERERELRELNDQLEQRVQARTGELTRANQRLAEAGAAKDRFLATLSHELRTPLTPLRAGLDLLKAQAPPELHPILEAMERNLIQEGRLIDDLLDIARITAGKLALETRPTDLQAVLKAAIETVSPRAQARGQRIALAVRDSLPPLKADPLRLQQVVCNLLDNAVKFSPAGGRIAVTAWREAGVVCVEVTDSGPGIDPEFLPHVFEPFRQADSSSRRQHGGLGLGLAIAQQIVARHGGALTASNAVPGPGARFTFTFPLVETRAEGAAEETHEPGQLRVLLVDDSLDTIRMLGQLLTFKGMRVREACSVAEALEHVRAEAPDVIISDIGMPEQDGYDLLRALRADKRLAHIPVVAATGYVGSQEQEHMAHVGFAASLSKPFDLAELLATLERVCPQLAQRKG